MKKFFCLLIVFVVLPGSGHLFAQTGSLGGVTKYAHKNFSGVIIPLTLDSVIIGLYQNNQLYYQDTSDGIGQYSIDGIAPGTYEIRLECHKKSGGYGSVDAQAIARHFVQLNNFSLSGIFKQAAHVGGHTYINSTDALLVTRRFVGLISSYPVGTDWVFENFSISVTANQNTIQNIYGLCYGDVNGTYTPFNSTPTTP